MAIRLSQKSGKPVKMTMAREDVFRASGPAPGGNVKVKIGATKDGRIVAAECIVEMQAGAFPGSPVGPACMCSFACYDIDNIHIVGFDVVSNRPKVAAYRAPGAPISAWAVESTIDILAQQLDMDPIDLRLKNAAKKGTKTGLWRHLQHHRHGRDARGREELGALPHAGQAGLCRAAWRPASGSTSAPIPAPPATSARTAR